MNQAKNYDFIHRPFEDKAERQRKEREQLNKKIRGILGDPKNS